MKKVFLSIFLVLLCFPTFAQPSFVGTALENGTYSEIALNDLGAFRQAQLAALSSGSSREWNFIQSSGDFTINWRPYTSGQTLSGYNTVIDPATQAASARYNSGTGGQPGLLPSVQAGSYYTINITEFAPPANQYMSILESNWCPDCRPITSVSGTGCIGASGYEVTVTLDFAPAANEYVYVRYSTDGFTTSSLVEVNFSGGTSGTATIPDQGVGAAVDYYVYSTNRTLADIQAQVSTYGEFAHDMMTVNLNNNGGSNYIANPCTIVCVGDVTLSSQAEVNAFNCSEVTGNLIIAGGDITNLSPLSSLTEVGGDFTISNNSALTNLDGLSSITAIAGNLSILFQPNLSNLNGLSSLSTVGGLISITTNSSLTNLDGLSLLTLVGGDLIIINNTALTEFCGLFTLMNSGGPTGNLSIALNAVNPTQQQIIDGGPCPGVCAGDITLSSQAEVHAFDCTSITGNLTIEGADITDLSPLSSLTSVGVDIFINNNAALGNLNGLSSLTSVGRNFRINSNAALGNLDGLSSLTSVGGFFGINNNPDLSNLDGLSSMKSVNELEIKNNSSLTNLNGLSSITSAVGICIIQGNPALTNLDGLSSVESVVGAILIADNPTLTNLNGLSSITSAAGYIIIFNNSVLSNLDGLSSLASVGGELAIANNNAITNLDGLSSLTSVGDLIIQDNPALSEFCGLFTLLDAGGLAGSYTVTGNVINPTQQDIIDGGPCGLCPDNNILFVKADASGTNSGLSWDDAFTNLQDALTFFNSGECPDINQIWVAAETYYPDEGDGYTDNNRTHSFVMKNNLAIYGGFAGTEDPLTFDLANRDFVANETILSGDIDQNNLLDAGNSYHVVTGSGTDATAILDGFSITRGFANGASVPANYGAGMYIDAGSPVVANNTFFQNVATANGGGLAVNDFTSEPVVKNCRFFANNAQYGGGIYIDNLTNFTVVNSTFTSNMAFEDGGAMYLDGNFTNPPVLTNNTFFSNMAARGGAMFHDNSSAVVTNSIFFGNTATEGPVFYTDWSNPATETPTTSYSLVDVANCTALNVGAGGTCVDATMIYSSDPLFVDAEGTDNTIGTSDDDLRLLSCSPAINTGDNTAVPAGVTTDLDGNPRFYNSGIVDMGAYEYQGEKPTNPTDGGEIAAAQTICSGGTPDAFTSVSLPSGHVGVLEYQWQSSITNASSGFADIAGANAVDYQAGMLTQTTWFRRLAKVECETEWVESNVVQVDVNPVPTEPNVATPITGCEGDVVIISATGSGTGDLVFLDNALVEIGRITMGGNPTQNFNAGALAAGTYTFYAAEDDGTCSSNPVAIDVTVNPLPAAPTAAGTTICEGESAVLTAVTSGIVNWYSDPALTNLVATGSVYTTGTLTTTTDYYVTNSDANGCESLATTVTVTVNPLPVAIITGDDGPFCPFTTIQFSAPAGMATYSWNIDGEASIGSWDDNNGFTPGPADEQDVQVVGDCGSVFTLTLTVTDNEGCTASTQQTYMVEDSDIQWDNEPQDYAIACDVDDIETELQDWFSSIGASSNCVTGNADYFFHLLQVNTPANIQGSYAGTAALFGPTEFMITGDLVMADPALACVPLQNDLTGKIALIDRGSCTFTSKVKNAQDAGAIGVIVVNNVPGGGVVTMGGTDPTITIPSLSISYEDGLIIKQAMQEELVNVTLNSSLDFQPSDYPVLFRAGNACGQRIEKSVTLSITDTAPPMAVCQNITVYLDATGNATITAADLDGGSTDNCGTVSFSASQTAFTCSDVGANNVTLTVSDGNGNESECVSVVNVADTITPDPGSISGASNIDYGSSTGDLILSGNFGEVKKWQKRLGASGTWTDIANTTTSYNEIPTALGTWQYRALVQASPCEEAYTEPHSVTVGSTELTIGGSFTANDKIYDDNTDATFDQNNLILVGVVGTDDVSLTGLEIDFESKDVGNHTVSITNAELTGADKDNYTLSLVGSPTTTANINPGPPVKFLVTAPDDGIITSPKLSNIAFDAKVTLVDAFDNPTLNIGGDVTITLTGSGGATPGDLRFQGQPTDPVTQTLGADESSVDFEDILYTGVSAISGMDVMIDANAAGTGSADGLTGESNYFSVRGIFFAVEADPTNLPADGTSKSDITVTLLDNENDPLAGQEITIETDLGTLMEGTTELTGMVTRTTDANGQVMLQLRADDESAIATVLAKCPGACPQTVEVAFTLNAPVITGFTPGEQQATVVFNPPTNPGSTTISNYEYSLNDGTDWNPFAPADDASPVTITGLTEYQTYPLKLRALNEAGTGAASASFEIYACANPIYGGELAADQNLFEGDIPDELTNEADASGNFGVLEYKWQKSTTNATDGFDDLPGATGADYQPDATLETTWFRRLAKVTCKADWTGAVQSNVVQVYIYQPPLVEITSPEDGVTVYEPTLTVSGTAADPDNDLASVYVRINGGGWQPATGTESWELEVPVVFGNNLIEARSKDTQGLESPIDEVTVFAGVQEITFGEGWNHISAYLNPLDADLETILEGPVNGNLMALMNDMHGGIYWPSQNLNTIGDWNIYEAYQAKLYGQTSIYFTGEMLADQNLDLESGFTYLPVLSNVPATVGEVFANPQEDVKLIFNHQTVGIYWPDGGIYTLTELLPGMGYLAFMNNPATATFPPYDPDALQAKSSGLTQPASGPWPLARTNNVHLISIDQGALQLLEGYTHIGAFNTTGECIGFADISQKSGNVLLAVYGDDTYTTSQDGAQEGEIITFRAYDLQTNSEADLTPEFSKRMPDVKGHYKTNGMSMITGFNESSTGIGTTISPLAVEIYPNPATDEFVITIDGTDMAPDAVLTMTDSRGTSVKQIRLTGNKARVGVADLQPGIYLIKIPAPNGPVMKKVIIR